VPLNQRVRLRINLSKNNSGNAIFASGYFGAREKKGALRYCTVGKRWLSGSQLRLKL